MVHKGWSVSWNIKLLFGNVAATVGPLGGGEETNLSIDLSSTNM